MKFLLGFLCALVVGIGGGLLYLKFGHLPVATADAPFPMEAQIVHVPMNARIDRELQQPPMQPSDEVYANGAMVYVLNCASCHGTPGKDVEFAKYMYPTAPQLWKAHQHGTGPSVTGVSDDPAGETYWKVKNGLRLTGMPAFGHVLSDEDMWDVSLLLANANKTMPAAVQQRLSSK
ncbi:MAG: cytochrome c [Acidobacteriota bacterium]